MTHSSTSTEATSPAAGTSSAEGYTPPTGYPAHAHAARLYGPQFADNPSELYQQIRRNHGPVAPVLLEGDIPAWLVLGYRELHYVSSNPQLFTRNSDHWNAWHLVPDGWPHLTYIVSNSSVFYIEGLEHKRRSDAVSDALDDVDRPEIAGICEQVADQLIDTFAGRGEVDLITDYAPQIPLPVIARLLGFHNADIPSLYQDLAESMSNGEGAIAAFQRLDAMTQQLARTRWEQPGSDILSRLLTHPAGITLEEAGIDAFALMVTSQFTINWIGNALRLMLLDDQFSMNLQGGRSSVSQALNEVLWEDTPVPNTHGGWAAHDCTLGGQRIRSGDLILLGLAGANTDPQVRPDSYTDSGTNRAHMSFGHGEHVCPASASELAEITARTAVEVLLDRLPDVELAVPADTLQWRPSVWMRGLFSLPVTFTPHTPRRVG